MKIRASLGTFLVLSVLPLVGISQLVQRQQRAPRRSAVTEIGVPGKSSRARVWTETDASGREVAWYSLSLDGQTFHAPRSTDYDLHLRYEQFDPRRGDVKPGAALRAPARSRLFVVQYWTQGIEDYRSVVRELGGEIHRFLPTNANLVEMDPMTRSAVEKLPFVRSVTPFHPAFKLHEKVREWIDEGRTDAVKVNVLTMRRGGQEPVERWTEAHGGTVDEVSTPTYLMTVTLSAAELPALAALDEVQWIDPWSAPENDMNKARAMHGADYLESELGFTGQGVRVEVLDGGFDIGHPDMQNFVIHNGNTVASHGTCTSGIVVGTGSGMATARGAAPAAFLVVGDYDMPWAGGSRYAHTQQLVDPNLSYQCVVQSNSWGGTLTGTYDSTSQEMDLILFDLQKISICNSMSNWGTNVSVRPQAWAKNIISVGALFHHDTLTKNDDNWGFGASCGPAEDGSIKPDIASYYDAILCPDRLGGLGYSGSNYYSNFGGTSGATPIVAGHLALIYQMWHEGLFDNPHPGATVFENAPKNTTAKALLINSASQWDFSGLTHDRTRVHQGWGHPDLQNLVDRRDRMLIVDETDVLTELDETSYEVTVIPGEGLLKVTLVYNDPPGTTSASMHRINDLDLTVTSPSSVVYHGNNGLLAETLSAPGGVADTLNTVENVFVRAPETGTWVVTVTASEVNQDSHVETGTVDVDYALVVSGAEILPTEPPAAPSNLRAGAAGHHATLAFDDNANNESGFELERSDDGFSFTPLVTLGVNETTYEDTGLALNTSYFYRVRATNIVGPSAYTDVLEVHTRKFAPADDP